MAGAAFTGGSGCVSLGAVRALGERGGAIRRVVPAHISHTNRTLRGPAFVGASCSDIYQVVIALGRDPDSFVETRNRTTFSDGCLGSYDDEERSEMRYVMRIADSVNHQIFERTLHFR